MFHRKSAKFLLFLFLLFPVFGKFVDVDVNDLDGVEDLVEFDDLVDVDVEPRFGNIPKFELS